LLAKMASRRKRKREIERERERERERKTHTIKSNRYFINFIKFFEKLIISD